MDNVIKGSTAAKTIYGIEDVPSDTWLNYAYALLVIAGSDHEVSSAEMKWLMSDFIAIINAPEDFIKEVKAFDFKKASLESILPNIKFNVDINYKRVLLYDAIKMAYADDVYAESEKKAVISAAKLLNVPVFLANTLEGLVRTEKSIETTRKSIFEVETLDWEELRSKPGVEMRKTTPLVKQTFGIEETTDAIDLNYGYALMIIAGADGVVSEAEKNWYKNEFARMYKTPDHIIEKVLAVDFKELRLEKVISDLSSDISINHAKTLLYSSIKMARADQDYAEEEKEAVRKAAEHLHIPSNIANTMNYLIDAENKIEKMRKTLFELRNS
ncbi:TerB family tellurite resistance protein [Flammeovirgaceae bacterium SG7u.111]|nr:TerB family tellurite resistance protein [Flammeovirgaceae bacterium SG7u.132]WPO33452.1 TerB family tellurite resistance protein [Flammeovirgaceae bacterium SG7u.111]